MDAVDIDMMGPFFVARLSGVDGFDQDEACCGRHLALKAALGITIASYRLVSGNGGNPDSRRAIQLSGFGL